MEVKSGSGDGGGCFGIKIWADTAKMTNIVIARLETDEMWSEKLKFLSNMKPRFRAE